MMIMLNKNIESEKMASVAMVNVKYWRNIWALFRTAEGFGIDKFFIIPDNDYVIPKDIKKKMYLEKEPYQKLKIITIEKLKEMIKGQNAVSVELDDDAESLENFVWGKEPLIILGAEDSGIPKEILKITRKVMMPMQGEVRCLNVACAGSVVLYDVIIKQKFRENEIKDKYPWCNVIMDIIEVPCKYHVACPYSDICSWGVVDEISGRKS